MNRVIIIIITMFMFSCGLSEFDIDKTIPDCIQKTISDSKLSKNLKTVKVQNVNNELHYWMNTDYTQFDGIEYIVNAKCDTICSFCGECIPAKCSKIYDKHWTVIWER